MDKIKRFLAALVRFWWIWPIATVACSLLDLKVVDYSFWGAVAVFAMASFSLMMQFVLFIVTLFMKKWWTALAEAFIGLVCGVIYIMFPGFLILLFLDSEPDHFGGEHPIPDGLEYSIPLGYVFERDGADYDGDTTDFAWPESTHENWPTTKPVEPVIDSTDARTWLQIWNGGQGGIYEFDFYYPALPSGKVYLRCFEVTSNTELSSDRVRERTETTVLNHTSFEKIIDKKEFTIYEGDWEEYYAVRVEVWFHDFSKKRGSDRKLLERVYRMEGWMR